MRWTTAIRNAVQKARPGWHIAFRVHTAALVIFAVVSVLRGANYLRNGIPSGSQQPIEFLSSVVHPAIWSAAYVVGGVVLLAGLIWRRLFAVGASTCAVLWILWGIAWVQESVGGSATALVTGLGFAGLGLAMGIVAAEEVDEDERRRELRQ